MQPISTVRKIRRETAVKVQGTALCIEIQPQGILIWRKGRQQSYLLPWHVAFVHAAELQFNRRRLGIA